MMRTEEVEDRRERDRGRTDERMERVDEGR